VDDVLERKTTKIRKRKRRLSNTARADCLTVSCVRFAKSCVTMTVVARWRVKRAECVAVELRTLPPAVLTRLGHAAEDSK
jgi:hypothetical protein